MKTSARTPLVCALLIAGSAGIAIGLSRGARSEDSSATPAPALPQPVGAGDPNIFVSLAKKVVPSVVNISTSKSVKSPFIQGAPDDLFRKFFEDHFGPGWGFNFEGPRGRRGQPFSPDQRTPRAVSLGTGFIIDSTGLILTNNHVVADADEIKITFTEASDEKPCDGQVVGRDADLDVALIQVKTKRSLAPLALGDSESLQVGEYVMAVGNPFGQGHSVSHGIISAKERVVPGLGLSNYLQTDAPINPGNSGGPLVNLRGEVIGINNAIDARAQGIGFAIPATAIARILPQLKSKGAVERGYMGALIGDLTPDLAEKLEVPKDLRAPLVTSVTPGEPAAKAGVAPYDVILEVNSRKVHTASEVVSAITAIPVGETASLRVLRSGKELTVDVTLARRPSAFASREGGHPSGPPEGSADVGMTLETLTPELAQRSGVSPKTSGVLISSLSFGGPADKAGLSRGDVILEVDRKPVRDVEHFFNVVKARRSYLLRVLKATNGGLDPDTYAVVILDLKE
jgi:serine protease Do